MQQRADGYDATIVSGQVTYRTRRGYRRAAGPARQGSTMNDFLYQPISVADIAARALETDLDRPVIILDERTTITAGQLRDSISRYEQALKSLVPAPRRAALLSKNRPEVPGVFYALSFAPIVATALHPMGSIEDYLYVIEDAEIDLLIYDDQFEDKVAELKARAPGLRHFVSIGKAGVGTPIETLAEPFQPQKAGRARCRSRCPVAHRLLGRNHRQAQGDHMHASQRADFGPDHDDRMGMAGRTAPHRLRAAQPCRGGDAAAGIDPARADDRAAGLRSGELHGDGAEVPHHLRTDGADHGALADRPPALRRVRPVQPRSHLVRRQRLPGGAAARRDRQARPDILPVLRPGRSADVDHGDEAQGPRFQRSAAPCFLRPADALGPCRADGRRHERSARRRAGRDLRARAAA